MSRIAYRKIAGKQRKVRITGKGKHQKVRIIDKDLSRAGIAIVSVRMVGNSMKRNDIKRHAKKPGLRRTAWGSTYFENRRNRSDNGKWL